MLLSSVAMFLHNHPTSNFHQLPLATSLVFACGHTDGQTHGEANGSLSAAFRWEGHRREMSFTAGRVTSLKTDIWNTAKTTLATLPTSPTPPCATPCAILLNSTKDIQSNNENLYLRLAHADPLPKSNRLYWNLPIHSKHTLLIPLYILMMQMTQRLFHVRNYSTKRRLLKCWRWENFKRLISVIPFKNFSQVFHKHFLNYGFGATL